MKGRFQRGKIGGISPFFAFQDIITSAMAVLITVVMLLALNMGEPGHAAPGEPGEPIPPQLRQQLASLLDELSRATADLRVAQDASAAAKLNPAALRVEIEIMRGEIASIQAISRAGTKGVTVEQRSNGSKIVLAELEKHKAANAAVSAQVAQQKNEAARSQAEMKRAENTLRERESQLLAEQAKKNELWLIPERSKTSKEPVLAVVSANSVILQRFDHPEKSELRGNGLPAKFEGALKTYSKLDQYIVIYLKPSGIDHFDALVQSAKSAGFEIGYDAIGEEVSINFSKSK